MHVGMNMSRQVPEEARGTGFPGAGVIVCCG